MRDDGGLSDSIEVVISVQTLCTFEIRPIGSPDELFVVLIRKRKTKLVVWGLTKFGLT